MQINAMWGKPRFHMFEKNKKQKRPPPTHTNKMVCRAHNQIQRYHQSHLILRGLRSRKPMHDRRNQCPKQRLGRGTERGQRLYHYGRVEGKQLRPAGGSGSADGRLHRGTGCCTGSGAARRDAEEAEEAEVSGAPSSNRFAGKGGTCLLNGGQELPSVADFVLGIRCWGRGSRKRWEGKQNKDQWWMRPVGGRLTISVASTGINVYPNYKRGGKGRGWESGGMVGGILPSMKRRSGSVVAGKPVFEKINSERLYLWFPSLGKMCGL